MMYSEEDVQKIREECEERIKKDRDDFNRILGAQIRLCETKHPMTAPFCKNCRSNKQH